MERPGYLGAIEAFSLYEPEISAVPLCEDGLDLTAFTDCINHDPVRFFYGIPNSQNPSGCTYQQENRRAVAALLQSTDTVFYEDDAFGELFFDGKARTPVKKFLPDQAVTVPAPSRRLSRPAMRIGWMFAPQEILKQFNTAKQAADLHSNFFCQKVLHRYLMTTDLDTHLGTDPEGLPEKLPAHVRSP